MNLQELRNKIKNITDYNPEVQTYLDDLDRLINDSYCNIYTAKRWNFAQETKYIDIFPDVLSTALLTAAVVDGSRRVTFSADVQAFKDYPAEWEGQIFQHDDRDYHIDQVISFTEIRLREPFRGTTEATDTNWKIAHRHYNLPADLIEILNLQHADAPVSGTAHPIHGKKASLARRRAEELNLKIDKTSSYSEAYVMETPVDIPAGEKFGAPVITPWAENHGIAFNTYWEFAWAFMWDGVVGPLSEPQVVYTGLGEAGTYPIIGLILQQWDDQLAHSRAYDPADIYRSPLEGYKKILVYNSNFDHNTGERRGLPCWRYVRTATSPVADRDEWQHYTIPDTSYSGIITDIEQMRAGQERYIEIDGQHQRFRPYPRPQGSDKTYDAHGASGAIPDLWELKFRQWILRYLCKPKLLCTSTDSPEMPYEFHQLIIYSVLFEVFTKGNNSSMAAMYDKKIEDAVKVLERRYIDRTDTFWQRGQFGISHNGVWMDADSFRKLN
jgi:hypothetical protein